MDHYKFLVILSYLFTFCLIGILIKFSFFKIKKSKNQSVPLIGGTCIFITLLLFSIVLFYNKSWPLISINQFSTIVFSTFIIFIIGLLDDLTHLSILKKVFFEIIAAFILIFGLNLFDVILLPFIENYYLNIFILIIFIIGLTNSINLIDGIDNLAAGLSFIITFSFIIINNLLLLVELNYFLMIVIGSLLAYLSFNIFIKRFFLGDSGSLLLGWVFAILSIFLMKSSQNVTIHIPMLILALPAFDVFYVMFYRFINEKDSHFFIKFESMFKSDNSHIHYNIMNKGINVRNTCIILYCISIFFSLISVMLFIYIDKFFLKSLISLFMITLFILFRIKVI